MKGVKPEENKKVSRKEFRYDRLSENSQDVFDEVMESSKDKTTTTIIDKICAIAYKKIRKPEVPRVLAPPNCGWCIYHPEYGDICVYGIPKPIRIALLKHRKLRYFDCELCAVMDWMREKAKQLDKIQKGKTQKDFLKELNKNQSQIKFETGYQASRDIKRFVLKYRTLSPAELSEHILEVKAIDKSPESITAWLKRHPTIHEELKKILSGDVEAEKKMRESLKKKKKMPQEMMEEYAR